jgi:ParB-like chromosome segregation protein Spo0J
MVADFGDRLRLPSASVLEDRNFNARLFYGDLDLLAIQLMTEGQREPIKVRRDGLRYFVVDGHRRRRAFERAARLRIAPAGGGHVVLEGERVVRAAPGPARPDFDPGQIDCRVVAEGPADDELLASQLVDNRGKPFTFLERMLFLSRLSRTGRFTREELVLKAGVSRTTVANADRLNAADPRLLECVGRGRISQKLALRLVRAFPVERQIVQVEAAMSAAGRHHRVRLLPKDFEWVRGEGGEARQAPPPRSDAVRLRLGELAARVEDAARFAANDVARDRLDTAALVHRYATGRLSYPKLEAHLLGRE